MWKWNIQDLHEKDENRRNHHSLACSSDPHCTRDCFSSVSPSTHDHSCMGQPIHLAEGPGKTLSYPWIITVCGYKAKINGVALNDSDEYKAYPWTKFLSRYLFVHFLWKEN